MIRRMRAPAIRVLGEVGMADLEWDDTPEGWQQAEADLEAINEMLYRQDASPWVYALDQCADPARYLRKASR